MERFFSLNLNFYNGKDDSIINSHVTVCKTLGSFAADELEPVTVIYC